MRALSCAALLALGLALNLALTSPAEAKERDWVFVYYMSYDNNLEGAGRPILDMLGKGITNDRAAVVCFADFRDTKGMLRYELTHRGEKKTRLDDVESSGAEKTLASCLRWVKDNYRAKKYAVVFLDHGGRLGEMCLDENARPGEDWLYVPEVAEVMETWRGRVEKQNKSSVELCFLQQCGKGALENYHALRKSARYVMASPTIVGAPNYYYTKALRDVISDREADGLTFARRIAARETDNMFTTYTTLSGEALEELPSRLDAVLRPLLSSSLRRGDVAERLRPCFDPRPEQFFDGFAFLEQAYGRAGVSKAPLTRFKAWAATELVVQHRVSPLRRQVADSWCGFSIYSPRDGARLDRYRRDYPLYRETQLDELHDKLLGRRSAVTTASKVSSKVSTTVPASNKRYGTFQEAMLAQVKAAGLEGSQLRPIRVVLEDYERSQADLRKLRRSGQVDADWAASRARQNRNRLRARLEARLPERVFTQLDPKQAMRQVRR